MTEPMRDRLRPALTAMLVVAAVLAVGLAVVVGVDTWKKHHPAGSPYAAYCDEVVAQRELIGAAAAAGPQTGLIKALPSFRALQAKAPADIVEDWRTVTDAIQGLIDALHRAGVDPSTYDRAHPPAGVDAHERALIDAAATKLDSAETQDALNAVDREALDVCHSPLSL